MSDPLRELADRIRRRNAVDGEIAQIIDRPAERGHIGEFIASKIFDITLYRSAAHKGSDGKFASGDLRDKTVNIKFYGKREGVLAVPDAPLQQHLALAVRI